MKRTYKEKEKRMQTLLLENLSVKWALLQHNILEVELTPEFLTSLFYSQCRSTIGYLVSLEDTQVSVSDGILMIERIFLEDWSGITLKGWKFHECLMTVNKFIGTKFIDCIFEACVITACDFRQSTLQNCTFTDCVWRENRDSPLTASNITYRHKEASPLWAFPEYRWS